MAAGHHLTAETAANVLLEGGTAIDAAIAALAMSCVCEPVLASPGGGGFAMLRDGATGQVELVDFFPHTPKQRNPNAEGGITEIEANFGAATQVFHIGPATAATPSLFEGLQFLHGHGATMSFDALIQPAIQSARRGVAITPFQHYLSDVVRPIMMATEETANVFAPNGELVAVGETFRNPGLADAFEILAQGNFAASEVGAATIAAQRARGHLTATDLNDYQVVERTPKSIQIAGATVHLNPLPAASGTMIGHSLAHLESPTPVGIAKAFLATDKARNLANGDFASLDSAVLRQLGTTHISVIDSNGTACAVTTSNGVGNGEIVEPFGFMLNNILGEEDINPGDPHEWPLDVRMSSGMCPTLIEMPDGSLTALGSGGSNRIRSAICQVVVQMCLNGRDLDESVRFPRLHVENGHLDFEDLFGEEIRAELQSLFPDHRAWPEPNLFYGGGHAARLDAHGRFSGVGDARRSGAAIIVG